MLNALSQGLAPEITADFKAACATIMEHAPATLDRGNFLKISLPIFTRLVQRNPLRFETMAEYASRVIGFIDAQAVTFLLHNPIAPNSGEDVESQWYEWLATRFEEQNPV